MLALGLMVTCMVTFSGINAVSAEVYTTPAQTPMQEVQDTISEFRHILREFKGQSQIRQRRSEIEQVVRGHVNYERMARRSLGEAWMVLTDDERDEFTGLFVHLMRDALANRLCEYSDQEIRYLSEEQGPQFATVSARLLGRKVDMSIDFRLTHHSAGRWLLYDAVIDGVSIVDNYRAQFAAIIRELSYEGLLLRMKQRTLLVKLFEKDSCL